MEPASPWPWRAVQAGPGWMLQADDGSWVANFHSQADAEYVIAALEVYHRFHVLEEAEVEPKPASPLPWRIGTHYRFVKTGGGTRKRSAVIDPQGREVAHVLTTEDGDFRDAEYLVCAANAYPRLKERLDKALEACKAALACEAERQQASRATVTGDEPLVELPPDRMLYLRIVKLAREALEMAKEGKQK